MNTASIKLYDILVEKGVDKATAREAVGEFVTREEADRVLASKADIANLNTNLANLKTELIMWIIGIQIAATGLLLASKLFT